MEGPRVVRRLCVESQEIREEAALAVMLPLQRARISDLPASSSVWPVGQRSVIHSSQQSDTFRQSRGKLEDELHSTRRQMTAH